VFGKNHFIDFGKHSGKVNTKFKPTNQPKNVKPKMRKRQLRSGINWPAMLQEKCVKQTGVKHGLVALYDVQEPGDNEGVYNMQVTGSAVARTWRSFLFTSELYPLDGLWTVDCKRVQGNGWDLTGGTKPVFGWKV
jgi:hypothetical protein